MSRRRARFQAALHRLTAVMESFEPRTLLTTYYVSPTGNDSAGGTSSGSPFKTIAKVNTLDLNAGDKVLFQGGQTFNAPAANATNRIADSGFESGGFNSWPENFDETAGNSSVSTTNLHSGSKAAKVSGTGFGGRGQNVSGITPNSSYLLRFWAKLSSGVGEGWIGITFFDGTTKLVEKAARVTTSTYTQYSIAAVAPDTFTIARVWFTKRSGSSILYVDDFQLNQTTGTVILNAADSGTAANPVTIGSYGTGRATINATDGYGLWGDNVAGLLVQDLNLLGSWNATNGTGVNGASGLVVSNSLADNAKLDFIRINNVDAAGFKYAGIRVEGNSFKAGYRDVRITNCTTHDNGDSGIDVGGQFEQTSLLYSHSNIYVGWCKAWNNSGIPNKLSNSGTGIIFGDVDGGTIERCVAWNNGALCNFTGGGPIGIWAWDCNAVVIQLNESYANKTGSNSLDGGGFDLDGGCTNCIMQYNYSHENDGAGYLLYQFPGARPINGNIIRYNISQNDARARRYAGIYMGGGSEVKNTDVYNNTIYMTPIGDTTIAGIKITGVGTGNKFRNNIIVTTGGMNLIDTNTSYGTGSVLFQGNSYYSSGGAFGIKWGTTVYGDLSSWRATGQEKNGTASVGLSGNPQLVSPGGGGTFGDASKLHLLTAYQLLSTSPLLSAALTVASPGNRDYFGSTLPTSGLEIGAFEASPTYAGATADETFRLRVGPSGARELFVNTATSAVPTIVWASGVYSAYTINGNSGDDSFILDLSNGSPLPSAGATFAGGAQNTGDDVSVIGTGGNDVIKVTNSAITPAASGPALNFSGVEAIVVDTGSGDDQLQFSAVVVPLSFDGGAGNDTFAINSGGYTFADNAADLSDALAVTVAAGASAQFNAPQLLRSLSVTGTAIVAAGGVNTINTRALSVAGQLDLNDNDLIIDYASGESSPIGDWKSTAYTGITKWLASGRNDGTWDGAGVMTSAPTGSTMSLGVAEAATVLSFSNSQTALFNSTTVDATSVLIRHTYAGDANLDGVVNADDYAYIDYFSVVTGASGYHRGDFNYDGSIDADDYAMIDLVAPQKLPPLDRATARMSPQPKVIADAIEIIPAGHRQRH